jgi:hypothetical protein
MRLLMALPVVLAFMMLWQSCKANDLGSDVLIGALRWDEWYDRSPEATVLDQPKWKSRIPFFARKDARGRLQLDGDIEPVLAAESTYARAMGIDYFIFGFYPDTGSWKRSRSGALALNRALSSYLALSDNSDVRFAISLNQYFPTEDLGDVSETLANLISDPRYVRTQAGTAPLFVLGHDGLDLDRIFGSEQNAISVFREIRYRVEQRAHAKLTIILLHYEHEKADAARLKFGLDMLSTYSDFAPGEGEQAFDKCINHELALWRAAEMKGLPYLPNVTIGWDSRPRGDLDEASGKPRVKRAWCNPPTAVELKRLFDAAKLAAVRVKQPFSSILVYAWNEFTEGGWLAPTWGEEQTRMQDVRSAIGRNRVPHEVVLRFPDIIEPETCPVQMTAKPREGVLQRCSVFPAGVAPSWPCPPGTSVEHELVRGPTGLEAALWPGAWRMRFCRPS